MKLCNKIFQIIVKFFVNSSSKVDIFTSKFSSRQTNNQTASQRMCNSEKYPPCSLLQQVLSIIKKKRKWFDKSNQIIEERIQ